MGGVGIGRDTIDDQFIVDQTSQMSDLASESWIGNDLQNLWRPLPHAFADLITWPAS